MRVLSRNNDMARSGLARIGFRISQAAALRRPAPGAAVGEHEAIVLLGHQSIDRNRNHARFHRLQGKPWASRSYQEGNEDTLLPPDRQRSQRIAKAIDAISELAIGPRSARINKGRLAAASCRKIALENVGREIVRARNGLDRRARAGNAHRKPYIAACFGTGPTLGL